MTSKILFSQHLPQSPKIEIFLELPNHLDFGGTSFFPLNSDDIGAADGKAVGASHPPEGFRIRELRVIRLLAGSSSDYRLSAVSAAQNAHSDKAGFSRLLVSAASLDVIRTLTCPVGDGRRKIRRRLNVVTRRDHFLPVIFSFEIVFGSIGRHFSAIKQINIGTAFDDQNIFVVNRRRPAVVKIGNRM